MAWTSVGFDGTITELEWSSKMAGLLGNGYVAAGNSDCLVTAVSGARQVSVAAGSLYGDGVVSTNSAPETLALTTPVNGQWYAVCLRRTWATNSAALVAVAGATTSTTTPTVPPTSFPVLNADPGVLTDQPIAWAWCNSANTTVVVYDIRLKAVKSLPPVVATSAERDAKFMSPTQGLQVWRDDLGAVETYYGLYNSSTNPGGRDTAGWYIAGRNDAMVQVAPTAVTAVSGTATTSALGTVSFSACTFISLDGVFSSKYKNYKIVFTDTAASNTTNVAIRLKQTGSSANTAAYYLSGMYMSATTNGATGANNVSQWVVGTVPAAGTISVSSGEIRVNSPYLSRETTFTSQITGNAAAPEMLVMGGFHGNTGLFDGITLFPLAGTLSGEITIYGLTY